MAHHLFLKVEEVIRLVDEEDLQGGATQVVPSEVDLSYLGQRPFEVVTHSFCRGRGKERQVNVSVPSHVLFLQRSCALLTLLFLLAAVVEVDVLCGELEAAGDNVHHRHQLTVLAQNQFFLLTCLFCFNPTKTNMKQGFGTEAAEALFVFIVVVFDELTGCWQQQGRPPAAPRCRLPGR